MAGPRKKRGKPDLSTYAGIAVALAGVLGGYILEHGKVGDVLGESAALIVFGGTLGATLVGNPLALVKRAFLRIKDLLVEPGDQKGDLIEQLIGFAVKARKNGIVSIESEAMSISDPFLRKSMMLAVDGLDLQEIRTVMQLEIDVHEQRAMEEAKVWESAGGFAPTIGIIGAVLGLIIVMGQLKDMNLVGKGIAAAFVATIYGVGSANILFLPAAHKIKLRAHAWRERQELILEGVCGIVEGMNPKMIRSKLEAYVEAARPAKAKEQKTEEARKPAA